MSSFHSFHIPVMGTGFTIDTPIKIAHLGISSVISLVDDGLIEEMRAFYCKEYGEDYRKIKTLDEDARARRITEYLNLVNRIVQRKLEEVRISAFEEGSEITTFFELLEDGSELKDKYLQMLEESDASKKQLLQRELRECLDAGSIDVNIMTKLDRENYINNEKLSREFSDAIAALRGFANSELESSVVFSAGVNPRLYSSVSEFDDFFADGSGESKKKIILKVNDYRSALTQGRIFAKKGIWVSEYRIESCIKFD